MDRVSRPLLRFPLQVSERRQVPPPFPRAASQPSLSLSSFLACRQVLQPLLPEPQPLALLLIAPPVLQPVAQALPLLRSPASASLPFALRVWLGPVPQVSPVFAKLALPESAPLVLQARACRVSLEWACRAWRVAARFDRPHRPRNFR